MTSVGVAWCTYFKRPGLFYTGLRHGYRGAALFAAAYRRAGVCDVQCIDVDEDFDRENFDGTLDRRAEAVDVFYAASHGELRGADFRLVLHLDDWYVAQSGLDGLGPTVAVFDACQLVDFGDPNWKQPWQRIRRPHLRLVCGFESKATVSRGATLRGRSFAEALLRDEPVAAAWIDAVDAHSLRVRRDKPVVLGFGDSQQDADDSLISTLPELLAKPVLTAPAHVVSLTT